MGESPWNLLKMAVLICWRWHPFYYRQLWTLGLINLHTKRWTILKKNQPTKRTHKTRIVISSYRRCEQDKDKMRHLLYQASLWYELQTNRIWLWTRWWELQGSPQPQHQCSALASHAQMHCQKKRKIGQNDTCRDRVVTAQRYQYVYLYTPLLNKPVTPQVGASSSCSWR